MSVYDNISGIAAFASTFLPQASKMSDIKKLCDKPTFLFQSVLLGRFPRMPSSKLLNGVAHDIAHHALSGLSYLHPHLTQVCKRAGRRSVTLDLLREAPLPGDLPDYEPLRLASQALHRTFVGILESVGFTVTDVTSAQLKFHIPPDAPDDYSHVSCDSEFIDTSGRVHRHELPAFSTTNAA